MKRRAFLKSVGISGLLLPNLSFYTLQQALPPLSPTVGGQSIMPTALQVGDIILSTTNELISRIIRNQTDYPISHARVVYSIKDPNNPEFVEAVGSGVRIITYKDMMASDTLSVALRKTKLSPANITTLQTFLLSKIGADYDLGGVFEEWLALKVKFLDKIRSVALGSPKKFYCSELVAEAYKAMGIDLLRYNGAPPNRSSAPGRFVEMIWFDQLNYVGHMKY